MPRTACGCVALLAACVATLPAQRGGDSTRSGVPIDRIVAIVGTKPILASQVEERMVSAQANGQQLPTDSAARSALRRQILTSMVEEELLVQQAERDTSIKVSDQEVQDAVEQTAQNVRRQFASEPEFLRQLKLAQFGGVDEWRRWLAENQRRGILRDRLLEQLRGKGQIKPIAPTERQLREYWDENKGQAQHHPAVVSFKQIVIVPQADTAARRVAYARAESLLVELRHGANFATLAKRWSDDSASRDSGGELGWFRRGVMVKNFEATAFRLRPGEISDPVETPFGFHIIQVERIQPAEVQARHILITPKISEAQIAIARRLADSVRTALAAGTSFDTLSRLGDEDVPKLVEKMPITELAPGFQQFFAADSAVGVRPVLPIGLNSVRPQFVVLIVTARLPEGELQLDDVRDDLRSRLSQELGVRHYIEQVRRTTFVDVRP